MKNLLYYILFISVFSFSQEEKRLALVIGNSEYIKGPLKNPVNDAKLIAKALDSLGFEVLEHYNLSTQRDLKNAIREFGIKRDSANVGFVYYAGHGVQVNNENYLLPTDESFASQIDVEEYAVSVQSILRYLQSKSNQVNILVLDACRDNPFELEWNTTRSLKGDGLAKIPPPTGSLIAFSTDAGQTAADGKDINSIYTLSLYKNMLLEDTSLDQIFRNVRTEVLAQTNGNQRPVEATQLTGQTFYLNPGNYDDEFKAVEGILEKNTELTDALNILAPIIDDKPTNLRALHLNAKTYFALKNYPKAITAYEKVIQLNPNNASYWIEKAVCYAKIEDLEKALEDCNKAIEVEPENSDNYEMRGDFYRKYLKDYDKALADYNKGIELNPTDADLHFGKAYVYDMYLDKPDLAIENYLKSIELLPEIPNSYVRIARIMRFKKDFNNSVNYYTKAIALDTTSTTGYIWRGIVFQHDLKKPNMALKDYNKAIEVNSESYSGLLYRAKLYLELNEFEKAKLDISSAIKLDDKNPEAFYVLAQLHKLQGNKLDNYLALSDAIKYFENSYINNFNATGGIALESLLIDRGSISQSFGQLDNACKDYSTALELDKLESETHKEIEQLMAENCNN